jgi:hypothetical protein
MSKDYILRNRTPKAARHPLAFMYLSGIARQGLMSMFAADITNAQRFSKDEIAQHRENYPHITGRFVRLDAERKRIAKAGAGAPP